MVAAVVLLSGLGGYLLLGRGPADPERDALGGVRRPDETQVGLVADALPPAPGPGGAGDAGIRIRVVADAPGDDNRNRNGEYAVVENLESEQRAIGGWTLCDRANYCFRFPPGAVLSAGGRLVVYSGSGQADGTRYYMGRRRALWNNDGDTATLHDGRGTTVAVFNY